MFSPVASAEPRSYPTETQAPATERDNPIYRVAYIAIASDGNKNARTLDAKVREYQGYYAPSIQKITRMILHVVGRNTQAVINDLKDPACDPEFENYLAVRLAIKIDDKKTFLVLYGDTKTDLATMEQAIGSPLKLAEKAGSRKVLASLLDREMARLTPQRVNDLFPYACGYGGKSMAVRVYGCSRPKTAALNRGLCLAAKTGDDAVVAFLLNKKGIYPSTHYDTPIKSSLQGKHVAVVVRLSPYKMFDAGSVLMTAIDHSSDSDADLEMLSAVLKNARKDVRGCYLALIEATKRGLSRSVSLLAEVNGIESGKKLDYPISIAAKKGYIEILRILLERTQRQMGEAGYRSALILAKRGGQHEAVKLLEKMALHPNH